MFKKLVVVCVLFFVAIAGADGYCQDLVSEASTKIVRGTVTEIDWVAGKVVVRTCDFGSINEVTLKVDEITFKVTQDTKITKGTEDISLADMHLSDSVTVEYSNSLAGLKAVSITVIQ